MNDRKVTGADVTGDYNSQADRLAHAFVVTHAVNRDQAIRMLSEHPELLSAEAVEIIDMHIAITRHQGDQARVRQLQQCRDLIQVARRVADGSRTARKTSTLAIVALIVALACLPIAGAIMGHVARRQIRERHEDGDGIALAAVIVGWVLTAVQVCLIGTVVIGPASGY